MLYWAYQVGLRHVRDTACSCICEVIKAQALTFWQQNSHDSLNAKKCGLSHTKVGNSNNSKYQKPNSQSSFVNFIGSPSIFGGSMSSRLSILRFESLPLFWSVALRRPSMDRGDFCLQNWIDKPMACQHCLLIELWGDDDRLEWLAASS